MVPQNLHHHLWKSNARSSPLTLLKNQVSVEQESGCETQKTLE